MAHSVDQWTVCDPEEMLKLVQDAIAWNRPITIDWTNRTIQVLSDVKINPQIVLSSGPMMYQDVLARIDI